MLHIYLPANAIGQRAKKSHMDHLVKESLLVSSRSLEPKQVNFG